jgi:hypothetical protein
LVGRLYNIKKIPEALVVTSKKIGLEENADNFKHMFILRDQNAGRGQNKYFEIVPLIDWKNSNIMEYS